MLHSFSETIRILEYCSWLAIAIYFFFLLEDMSKTTTLNKNNKTKQAAIMASIAMVIALALVVSPLVAMDDVLATKDKKKNKGNLAKQLIEQSQSSNQNSLCVSGGNTVFSC